jgi:putative endonuclease
LPRSVIRTPTRRSTRAAGRRAEWRAVVHYRLRGYRVLGRNVWAGRYEVDLIVRRGRRLVFCEVKSKTSARHGDSLEMVGSEKLARMQQAAMTWLAAHPGLDSLEMSFEVVAARGRRLERVVVTL